MKDQVNRVANLGIPGVSLSVIDEEDMKGVEKKKFGPNKYFKQSLQVFLQYILAVNVS